MTIGEVIEMLKSIFEFLMSFFKKDEETEEEIEVIE